VANKKGIRLKIPENAKNVGCYLPVPGGNGGCVSIQQLSNRNEMNPDTDNFNFASICSMLKAFTKMPACAFMF
jgi:hypothetical protein